MAWKTEMLAAKAAKARATLPRDRHSNMRSASPWGKAQPGELYAPVSWKYDPARVGILVKGHTNGTPS